MHARWNTTRRAVLWALAALLGIALTAALSWSVSRLAHQRIGLSSQAPSVINGLVPAHVPSAGGRSRAGHPKHQRPQARSAPSRLTPSTPLVAPPVASPPAPPSPPVTTPNHSTGSRDDSSGGAGGTRGPPDD
jgi:hypothetical protein